MIEQKVSGIEASGAVGAGTIVYPPGGTYGPRRQRDYQLVLLHRGQVAVQIDGVTLHVGAQQVALLKPGHREYFRFASQTETHHSWLNLERPPLPHEYLAALDAAPGCLALSPAMAQLMEAALAMRKRGVSQRVALVALVASALALYVDEATAQGLLPRDGGEGRLHPAVAAAQALVRQRLPERIGLADLAQGAHVTPEYLVRLFRLHLGTTPVRYLWGERVRYGLHLLEHTGLSVAEVAEQAGFQSAKHFSRLVRVSSGLSPREVRRRSWNATAA
ncbi:MAG TPA: helix-turn-helix domain-containing protein [Chloroflexota bacterium]|nr:helix-turn-helix domain-containing protein [Chloroflexota bacterium]